MVGRGEKADAPRPYATTKTEGNSLETSAKSEDSSKVVQRTFQAPVRVLGDISRVLRSKNSGPYEITMDAMFESEATYRAVKQSGLLSEESVAATIGVSMEHIVWCGFFDPARAFKVTIPRIRGGKLVPAGGFMEDDVHGTQQHLELFNMKLPDELLARLAAG